MSDRIWKLSAADQHLEGDISAVGQRNAPPRATEPTMINHEDAIMPTAENVLRSVLVASGLSPATNRDAEPLEATQTSSRMAKAASAQVAETTSEAAEIVVKAAGEVKSAISESVVKAGKELDGKAESSLGPYGSPGTCVPSDLDPLAEAVHSGLDLDLQPKDNEDGGKDRESWQEEKKRK